MDFLMDLLRSFIPREDNDYKPYFFRARAMTAMAAIILFLGISGLVVQSIIVTNSDSLAAVISSVLVNLANGDRTQNGLKDLAISPTLQKAAQLKANDMAAKSYFAHTSPDGVTPWHWFKEAGYQFSYAGENLAVRFSDSIDVNNAWMNSPAHRANILNADFSEIGIATAEGEYQGQPAVFVVQEFGRPAAAVQPQPIAVATTTVATSTKPVATSTKPVATSTPKTVVAGTTTPGTNKVLSAASSSPVVAGTSTEQESPKVITENETFIAVRNVPATSSPGAFAATSGGWMTFWKTLFTSPKTLLNGIYLLFALFITVALSFMVFFEIKRQHPLNIFYGVGLLVLMVTLFYVGEMYIAGSLTIL